MLDLLWLIPIFPLAGFVILFSTMGYLPKPLVALVGAGSVGMAALLAFSIGYVFIYQTDMTPVTVTLYTWIDVGGFSPGLSFYLDGLTLTMLFVITGVGFLIHLYSTLFMLEDDDYSRFFA
jgi:NADH-quinone oxidoreductase subunit L